MEGRKKVLLNIVENTRHKNILFKILEYGELGHKKTQLSISETGSFSAWSGCEMVMSEIVTQISGKVQIQADGGEAKRSNYSRLQIKKL